MQIIIPAAGEGSRLFPWTAAIPKPLLPICGVPLLARILDKLGREVKGRVLVTCLTEYEDQFAYQLDHARADGIEVLSHDRPYGTAGELAFLGDRLEEEFFVYFADIWTEHDLRKMVGRWERDAGDNAPIAMLAYSPKLQVETGVPVLDGAGRIVHLDEKPSIDTPNLAGIGIFRKEFLRYAKLGEDLHRDAIAAALLDGQTVTAYELSEGYLDVGSFASFRQAQRIFRR